MRSIIQSYGVWGTIRLARDWVLTRCFYPKARLIRFPLYIRGRRFMDLGQSLTTGVNLRLYANSAHAEPVLRLGQRLQINDAVHIAALHHISIGDDTLIASRVFISDHNHGCYDKIDPLSYPDIPPNDRPLSVAPVVIGKRVWIGEAVNILPGVTIGDGAIIGAGAVVTRDVPKNSIAVGCPARVVKVFDEARSEWVRV